jgi:hypothetical protein
MTSLGLGINGAPPGQAGAHGTGAKNAPVYFVTMRLADGGASPGAAGVIANVSHAFQPSGLFCEANSP